jgi:hypothetical protein
MFSVKDLSSICFVCISNVIKLRFGSKLNDRLQ